MAVHYTCRCGANIRMPNNVVGRKARCNSCGYIFTVPAADLNPDTGDIPLEPRPEPPPVEVRPRANESSAEPGDWLGEFAQHESSAGAADTPRPAQPASAGVNPPASLLEFADREDILAPVPRVPPLPRGESGTALADEARSGIIETSQSFWTELLQSFVFFLDAGSAVTFMIIVLINLSTIPLGYIPRFGFLYMILVSGYMCTFYMAVIKEVASGEDELPNVWVDNITDDLVLSIFRFGGTWAWVLMPALAYAIISYANAGTIHMPVFYVLAIIGLFFWPVVILGVAIGGSFNGLWPHTVIHTALIAPLPYLALCGVLLVAAGITCLPFMDAYNKAISDLSTRANQSFVWVATVINAGLSSYAAIIAMRAIGLYYRHYKKKFSWVAE
jgi:hypothetical protein